MHFDKEKIIGLCFATRKQIDLCGRNNLNWIEDSSNATDKYTRNFSGIKK